jgi:ribonucleoside-diphosphate reductase alpha chain
VRRYAERQTLTHKAESGKELSVETTETHVRLSTRHGEELHKQSQERSSDANGDQSPPHGVRHRLPAERPSLTHHFTIGQHDGYLTVGLFPDGQPGEIFVSIAKAGSTLGGLMDSFAKAISIGLQYGVPLELFCAKFSHTRFEPSGWTGNADLGFASSIMDYIFRWLQLRFFDRHSSPALCGAEKSRAGNDAVAVHTARPTSSSLSSNGSNGHHSADALASMVEMGDAPTCNICGAICVRSGACFRCLTCGQTTGCG